MPSLRNNCVIIYLRDRLRNCLLRNYVIAQLRARAFLSNGITIRGKNNVENNLLDSISLSRATVPCIQSFAGSARVST